MFMLYHSLLLIKSSAPHILTAIKIGQIWDNYGAAGDWHVEDRGSIQQVGPHFSL